MNNLYWQYDETTEYWAKKLLLPIKSMHPIPQYDGMDYRLWEDTWKKHILKDSFPEYCQYPNEEESLLCSQSNIIHCFRDQKLLEGLVLTVAWGRMTRSKGKIYQKSNQMIEETLYNCLVLIEKTNSIKGSWNLLINRLNWSYVITSKCLHFLSRSLDYSTNPPVPIDNKVIINNVWPKFKEMVNNNFTLGIDSFPEKWWDYDNSWSSYNRYITAINCWASTKGWTTTELESTIFDEYYPKTNST
ncbi:hypothetical protein ACFLUA_02255 [Chloroflexota bacterium]